MRNNFGGFPGGNMQQLMRQAQKMQEKLTQAQEELDAREYEASAGGGAVSCKVSGKRELLDKTRLVTPIVPFHIANVPFRNGGYRWVFER